MDSFEINEVAIIYSPEDEILHGLECTVLSAPYEIRWMGVGSMEGSSGRDVMYDILVNGEDFCVFPHELRKKKPPEEEIDWVEKLGLVKWNPTKQGVTHE